MKEIFVISDTHCCHEAVLTFKNEQGELTRPGFSCIEEMDERIIDEWNKTVKDGDSVYCLGDFVFGGKDNIGKIASRLKGRKRLVMGNHDYEAKLYYPWFQKVMSWREFGDLFSRPTYLCHFPVDEMAFNYRHKRAEGINIHGHLHERTTGKPYHVNVCVEHTSYKPISVEDIVSGHFR